MSEWEAMAPTVEQIQAAFRTRGTLRGFTVFPRSYSPADELRDRLNDSLQDKPPASSVNTSYWRKL